MKFLTLVIAERATAPAAVEAFNVPLSSFKSTTILKPKTRVSKGAYHVPHTEKLQNSIQKKLRQYLSMKVKRALAVLG